MAGIFAILLTIAVSITVLDSVQGELRKEPNFTYAAKWMLPLKSNRSRETVIRLGSDSLGGLPEKVAITSEAKSRVIGFIGGVFLALVLVGAAVVAVWYNRSHNGKQQISSQQG